EFNSFLEENLWSERIQNSKSPFASAFFFVKKKDLLRQADHETRENDNEDVTILKPEFFCPIELVTEDNNFLAGAYQRHGDQD
ncbi:hypothetical protein BDR06DRAFT_888487, partial [Suillus hirtellus]